MIDYEETISNEKYSLSDESVEVIENLMRNGRYQLAQDIGESLLQDED
jgi:hypothetical protein